MSKGIPNKPLKNYPTTMYILRNNKGWTQLDLAKRVGCNQNYIARLENAQLFMPDSEKMLKVAIYLGYKGNPYDLLERFDFDKEFEKWK